MRRNALVSSLAFIAACTPSPAPAPIMSRPAGSSEYAPYLGSGTATISGQAFLLTQGGEAKRAAGSIVDADPLTPFAEQWFIAANGRWDLTPNDTLFARARRRTTADADGRFEFTDLPGGRYLISTSVTWKASNGYGLVSQGGWLADTLTVRDGEKRTLVMNAERPLHGSFLAPSSPNP